jgi:hypothetical protein
MLKRIPKSDISIRPFKAYKEWSFSSGSTQINFLEANETSTDLNLTPTGSLSGSIYPKNSIYGQLKAQFYNGNEDNPINRTGLKTNVYNNNITSKERYLNGIAKIISIPQVYVGEGIKRGSLRLLDYSLDNTADPYIDDSYGNIVSETGLNELHFTTINLLESGSIFYFNSSNDSFTASIDYWSTPSVLPFIDIQNSSIELVIDGISHPAEVVSIDLELGNIYVKNTDFLPGQTIGNVFYNQGLIVFTRNLSSILRYNWNVSFKSTKTIYENEYLLIVNQDEFNVSTNPSAVVNVGKETEFVTGSDGKIKQVVTNPGVSYIRKYTELSNGTPLDYRYVGSIGNNKGGFEQAYVSSSIDTTGSFLTPMITTIGLYDDDLNLVAVAKLPQPIKSEHDIPVNFIVRFDT